MWMALTSGHRCFVDQYRLVFLRRPRKCSTNRQSAEGVTVVASSRTTVSEVLFLRGQEKVFGSVCDPKSKSD